MKRENFNSGWKVWRDNDPFELVFRVPEEAESVTLPHDAMFAETQQADSVNGGSTGFLDGGAYKYHKRFFVPESCRGGKLILHFEGVYSHASVFVNQSLAGQQAFGYTEFFVELQDYIKFGEENEILVAVKCGTKNSRWYSGAGIYRDVHLLTGGAVHFVPYGLRLQTESLDNDGAAVLLSTQLKNDSLLADTLNVTFRVKDPGGNVAAESTYPVRIRGQQALELQKRVYLAGAKLWSDETPNLYTVEVEVRGADGTLDTDSIVTGVRLLTVDAQHGLRVNGKTVKLRGACLHHDQFILGAATFDDYEYRRVKRLKEAGFNAVRSAHNHASQALLKACDQLGVYVMDELCDIWDKSKTGFDYALDFHRDWERDVESMVAADFNHPSVVLYSTGNEIFEIATEKGIETSRMLGDKFRILDPTRFTTNGINGAFAAGDGLAEIVRDLTDGKADTSRGDVNLFMGMMATQMPHIVQHPVVGGILEKLETTMDVLGYNYMTARYLPDAKNYPDRVMVGSETYPKQIAENWDAITQTPAAIGDFTWTGWDYLGEVLPVFPNLVSPAGDLSGSGVRRPMSYYREIVFGLKKGPCIAAQDPKRFGTPREFGPWQYTDCTFNYTYPGEEGKPIMIQVFGGGDSVELFRNGKSLGVQPCGKTTDFETQFNTTYEPGELIAVAYENGAEIGRTTLQTAGVASEIHVDAELDGPAKQLVFLNIELRDAAGVRVFAEQEITLEVTGGAELLAFGSENAKHRNGYTHSDTTTTDGCALSVLKRTGGDEPIRVKLATDGLEKELAL